MVVRRLHHLRRGCPVAEVATGHDEEALNRLDWNGDLACCDDHYGRSNLALAKQCAIGWSGFEGWQAQLSLLVEGVSRWYLALGMREWFQGLPATRLDHRLAARGCSRPWTTLHLPLMGRQAFGWACPHGVAGFSGQRWSCW